MISYLVVAARLRQNAYDGHEIKRPFDDPPVDDPDCFFNSCDISMRYSGHMLSVEQFNYHDINV